MKVGLANPQIMTRGLGSQTNSNPANAKGKSTDKGVAYNHMKSNRSGKSAAGTNGPCGARLKLDTSSEKNIIRGLLI